MEDPARHPATDLLTDRLLSALREVWAEDTCSPDDLERSGWGEQFILAQLVTPTRVLVRPPGPLPRRWAEYLMLRSRLAAVMGELPPVASG